METMVKKSDCLSRVVSGKRYTIMVNSQAAVDAARAFIGSRCYRQLEIGGRFATQIEIVIDDPGYYGGYPDKWVAFSFIPSDMVQAVFAWIENNGFSGCVATFENEEADGPKEFELVTMIQDNSPVYQEDCCEVLENIMGDVAIIYYWDDTFECDACRGWQIFEGGDIAQGFHPCGSADTAYQILSRKGFRY